MVACCRRDAVAEVAQGRERQLARSWRVRAGQGDAAGRDLPKTLRPARKRKLVDEIVGSGACRSGGLPDLAGRHVGLPLQVLSSGAGRTGEADQGDLPDLRALWLSARLPDVAP
jgi:hypothetical protein